MVEWHKGEDMLKVVVFDSGWGGELFADTLEEQIPTIEVTRVIDWRNAPYSARGRTDICLMAERALMPYIGKVNLIVLASYAVTGAALFYLRWKYPEQKFVGFCPEMGRRLKDYTGRVMVLATGATRTSQDFQDEYRSLKRFELIEPDCTEWIQLVDDGEMTEDRLRQTLGWAANEPPDVILFYSTNFVDLKPAFSHIYGRKVRLVDEFSKVVNETCRALRLRGVHPKVL